MTHGILRQCLAKQLAAEYSTHDQYLIADCTVPTTSYLSRQNYEGSMPTMHLMSSGMWES